MKHTEADFCVFCLFNCLLIALRISQKNINAIIKQISLLTKSWDSQLAIVKFSMMFALEFANALFS